MHAASGPDTGGCINRFGWHVLAVIYEGTERASLQLTCFCAVAAPGRACGLLQSFEQ